MKITIKKIQQPQYTILISTEIDCDGFNTIQLVKYYSKDEYVTLFFDICSNEELPIMIKHCSDIIYKEIENELHMGKN